MKLEMFYCLASRISKAIVHIGKVLECVGNQKIPIRASSSFFMLYWSAALRTLKTQVYDL